MRTAAVLLVLAACERSEPTPTPAPTPTPPVPVPVTPVDAALYIDLTDAHTAPRDLANAPVILVSKTTISVGGKDVVTVAAALKLAGPIPELAKVLETYPDTTAILAADGSTNIQIVNRIVMTAKQAGKTQLLFAPTP